MTKTRKGWVAKNKGEFDIENMSFFRKKRDAVKFWGGRQEVVPVKVIFPPPKKEKP